MLLWLRSLWRLCWSDFPSLGACCCGLYEQCTERFVAFAIPIAGAIVAASLSCWICEIVLGGRRRSSPYRILLQSERMPFVAGTFCRFCHSHVPLLLLLASGKIHEQHAVSKKPGTQKRRIFAVVCLPQEKVSLQGYNLAW